MRLIAELITKARGDTDIVAAVGWSASIELFSCGDDQAVCRWNPGGEPEGKVFSVEATAFTDLQWCPAGAGSPQGAGSSEVFALGCTDGTIKLVSRSGRLEKSLEAHQGATLGVRWSLDGGAFASCGEDGLVRVWSRSGAPRRAAAQCGAPARAVAWSRDGDALAFCSGGRVSVKPLAGGGGISSSAGGRTASAAASLASWEAHDGLVLAVDWSPVGGLIVTGGEDRRYKVWDPHGRCLFASAPLAHPVCSAAWAPGGQALAVGVFDELLLCSAAGRALSRARVAVGSALRLAWSPEGGRLAACGGGGVALARVVGAEAEDARWRAVLEGERRVVVRDEAQEGAADVLEFKEPVAHVCLGHGHLAVATATQCHVFPTAALNTPHIFDLPRPLALLRLSARALLLVDGAGGLQIATPEGRAVCTPKAPGLRPELLAPGAVALSPDTLALPRAPGSAEVLLMDVATGRPRGEPYVHGAEVTRLALSQAPCGGGAGERLLSVVDANGDLFVVHPGRRAAAKLAAGVSAAVWHDAAPMLAAVADGRLAVWHHPAAALFDAALLDASRAVRGDSRYGDGAEAVVFCGGKIVVSRPDGARAAAWVPPHAAALHELARAGAWDKALRLCRAANDGCAWAVLAAAAAAAGELPAAEAAFAELGAPDRLAFARRCAAMGPARRAAELALYRRQPAEAEALLLQAGLVWRAVKVHVRLRDWPRALALAQRQRRHVAALLLKRARHLAGRAEPLADYRAAAAALGAPPDEAAARAEVAAEKQREREQRERPGGGGGGSGGAASFF